MSETIANVDGNGAAIVRQGFGTSELEQRRETASSAVVAQATAAINARYIVAMQRRRNWDDVRTLLLKECARPAFAERAWYVLPRGRNTVTGLTVRFAEAAIRVSGNLVQSTRTLYDDDEKRIINVSVTDLETNAVYERDVVLEKTIERRDLKDRVLIAQRQNSTGQLVYIVACTDDELLQKEGVIVSKTFRTLAMRLVPADIIEDCTQKILETRDTKDATDPEKSKKALLDAWAALGVLASDLKLYIGHDVAQFTKADVQELRGIYNAVREGETNWGDALKEKIGVVPDQPKPSVADKIKARQEAKGAAPAPSPQTDLGPTVAAASPATSQANPVAPSPQNVTTPTPTAARPAARATGRKPEPEPPFGSSGEPPPPRTTPPIQGVPTCAICHKPTGSDVVSTLLPDGTRGTRHPTCSPFGAMPPDDELQSDADDGGR